MENSKQEAEYREGKSEWEGEKRKIGWKYYSIFMSCIR